MERLQERRVVAHDKGDYKEVEKIEKGIYWKQTLDAAAHKCRNTYRKEYNAHIACQQEEPCCKLDLPSDDESHTVSSNSPRFAPQ